MTTTLRIDDTLKRDCDMVLDQMGMNLSCAITIFLKELTRRRAMPFVVRADGASERGSLHERYLAMQNSDGLLDTGRRAKALFSSMRETSDHDWTLDEINAEISAARSDRRTNERTA